MLGQCAFLSVPYTGTLTTSFHGKRLTVDCQRKSIYRGRRRQQIQAALDPTFITTHTPHHLHAIGHLLASTAATVADTAQSVNEVVPAEEVVKSGPIQSLANIIESCLIFFQSSIKSSGIAGAGGLSIIALTAGIKALLFPLNWKQMESTIAMQSISPKLKRIQTEYKDNPALINQMTAKLYKDENINPLLGCLPILFQLPVWLALYRALQNMAKDNLLNEPFLWVPSLQGPVSRVGESLNVWLFPLVDGKPPVGWHDAICYLILPALIVTSQIITTKIISPPSNDPSTKQANAFNNFLPIIVGWFVLNVPSALGLYMLTNNILTTAQTLFVKSRLGTPVAAGAADSTIDVNAVQSTPPDGFQSNGSAIESPAPKSAKSGKSKKSKRRKRR